MTFKSSRYSAGCLLLPLVEGGLAWNSREEKSQINRWLFVNNLGSVALKAQSLFAKGEDSHHPGKGWQADKYVFHFEQG